MKDSGATFYPYTLRLDCVSRNFFFLIRIPPLDFPTCVIGPQPELTADLFDVPETENYCWRNMFSSINLLRILNKLTKGKHARTMVKIYLKKIKFSYKIISGSCCG